MLLGRQLQRSIHVWGFDGSNAKDPVNTPRPDEGNYEIGLNISLLVRRQIQTSKHLSSWGSLLVAWFVDSSFAVRDWDSSQSWVQGGDLFAAKHRVSEELGFGPKNPGLSRISLASRLTSVHLFTLGGAKVVKSESIEESSMVYWPQCSDRLRPYGWHQERMKEVCSDEQIEAAAKTLDLEEDYASAAAWVKDLLWSDLISIDISRYFHWKFKRTYFLYASSLRNSPSQVAKAQIAQFLEAPEKEAQLAPAFEWGNHIFIVFPMLFPMFFPMFFWFIPIFFFQSLSVPILKLQVKTLLATLSLSDPVALGSLCTAALEEIGGRGRLSGFG